MQTQNAEVMAEALKKVYGVLKFSPEEIGLSARNMAILQQMSFLRIALESMGKEEMITFAKKTEAADEAGKKKLMEEYVVRFKNDPQFLAKLGAVSEKVLVEHIASLKKCGDDAQKREVAAILGKAGL